MSDRVGAIINKDIEVVKGRIGSFINNFMASANGCKMPYGPTMLGPFRSCMYPKILRSTNVRKAMAIRMGTRSVRILIKNTIRERHSLPLPSIRPCPLLKAFHPTDCT